MKLELKCTNGHPITVFDVSGAAQYVGLSVPSIKYHLYRAHDLSGHQIGNTLLFTRSELDHFLTRKQSPGRPRKETVS